MVGYVQHGDSHLDPGPTVASRAVPTAAQAVLAAPGGPVGPTWRPAGQARRVNWEQRKGPPCGATGRAGGWLPDSLLTEKKSLSRVGDRYGVVDGAPRRTSRSDTTFRLRTG